MESCNERYGAAQIAPSLWLEAGRWIDGISCCLSGGSPVWYSWWNEEPACLDEHQTFCRCDGEQREHSIGHITRTVPVFREMRRMMLSEVSLCGVFVSPIAVYAVCAVLVTLALRYGLWRLGALSWFWHVALFEIALYVCVLCLLVIFV